MNDKRITQETPIITTLPPDDRNELVGQAHIKITAMGDGTYRAAVLVNGVLPAGEYNVFVDLREANRTGLKVKP